MIRRVYEQARKAKQLDEVVVATDDKRIYQHVQEFGGQVVMTRPDHRSGTDRCAEVAAATNSQYIINIQGDEPFIDPQQIDQVVAPLLSEEGNSISTLAKKIETDEQITNPNVVKVVFDRHQRALYFSRSAIPFLRDLPSKKWLERGIHYKHIGIYGFRRDVLTEISELAAGRLEQSESLEQLRWLEAGYPIHVSLTDLETIGIDRPEDLQKI